MKSMLGKWTGLVWFLMVLPLESVPTINLQVLDSQGRQTNIVTAGMPFFVKAMVHDVQTSGAEVRVDTSAHITLQGGNVSVMMHAVNGVHSMTTVYQYVARANHEGVHTIGPASLEVNGTQVRSNVCSVNATLTREQAQAATVSDDRHAFLTLTTSSDTAVVGQKVILTLRCYFQPYVQSAALDEVVLPGWHVGKEYPVVQNTQEVRGIPFNCSTYQWEIYPDQAGNLIIPAVGARIAIARKASRGWTLVGLSAYTEQILSNPTKVMVSALTQSVDSVGKLRGYSQTINQAELAQTDAAVLTVSIEGTGNVRDVSLMPVVPEGVRVFESATRVEPVGDGSWVKKQVEYVVQAMQEGVVTLPARTVTFFDPETNQYAAVSNNPLTLTITPGVVPAVTTYGKELLEEKLQEPAQETGSAIRSIRQVWDQRVYREPAIPEWLFISMLIIQCIGAVGIIAWRSRASVRKREGINRKKRYASARQLLVCVDLQSSPEGVYAIFKSIGGDAVGERVFQALERAGAPLHEREQWQHFFSTVTRYAFDTKREIHVDIEQMRTQALVWFDRLESIL